MTSRNVSDCLRALAGATLFSSTLAFAQQQVTVARDSTLHAEPSASAPAVTQLKQGTPAEVLGRQGTWVNVRAGSASGWMFSFNVTYPSSGGVAGTAAAPRRPVTNATIGIRGLEKDDLKNATFDASQLDALDGFAGAADRQKK